MTSTAQGNGEAHGANGPNYARLSERGLLMAGNALAPCIGCTLECFPRSCELITAWLGLLERAPRDANDHP